MGCPIIVRGHEDNVKSATATIIGLDPKSLGQTTEWERLDQDVVRCTLEVEESVEETGKRICVEDPTSSKHVPRSPHPAYSHDRARTVVRIPFRRAHPLLLPVYASQSYPTVFIE